MTIEPLLTEPAVIASIVTVVVAFVLIYVYTLLDKAVLFKQIEQIEAKTRDIDCAVELLNQNVKQDMRMYRELAGSISSVYRDLEHIYEQLNKIEKDKKHDEFRNTKAA